MTARRPARLRVKVVALFGPDGAALDPAPLQAEIDRLRAVRCEHEPGACCPVCPDVTATDGLGFPHPGDAKGRRRLQRCPRCKRLVPPERWIHAPKRAFFGCRACSRKAPLTTATRTDSVAPRASLGDRKLPDKRTAETVDPGSRTQPVALVPPPRRRKRGST